jgi:hypothetical protein
MYDSQLERFNHNNFVIPLLVIEPGGAPLLAVFGEKWEKTTYEPRTRAL